MNTKDWSVDVREADELIWSRGEQNGTPCGVTARNYRGDGTLLRIKERLEHALEQVNGELSLANHDDRIADVGLVALANVDGEIPVTGMGNR